VNDLDPAPAGGLAIGGRLLVRRQETRIDERVEHGRRRVAIGFALAENRQQLVAID
jgi:hypothetical protein